MSATRLERLAFQASRDITLRPLQLSTLPAMRRTSHPQHHRHPSRTFSTTPPHRIKRNSTAARQINIKPQNKPQPSLAMTKKSQQRAALTSGEMMVDVGPIPGVFISGAYADRPALVRDYADRWMWEKTRFLFFARMAALGGWMKFWKARTRAPGEVNALGRWERLKYGLGEWVSLDVWRSKKVAEGLYRDLYGALASGRMEDVRGKLKDGLFGSVQQRVAARGRNTLTEWELVRWNKRPKIRGWAIGMAKQTKESWLQSYILQAVVEFDSVQRVTRSRRVYHKDGTMELVKDEEASRPKNVREFLCVQKHVNGGKEGPWMAWGMTKPTSIEDLKRDRRERLGLEEGESLVSGK